MGRGGRRGREKRRVRELSHSPNNAHFQNNVKGTDYRYQPIFLLTLLLHAKESYIRCSKTTHTPYSLGPVELGGALMGPNTLPRETRWSQRRYVVPLLFFPSRERCSAQHTHTQARTDSLNSLLWIHPEGLGVRRLSPLLVTGAPSVDTEQNTARCSGTAQSSALYLQSVSVL